MPPVRCEARGEHVVADDPEGVVASMLPVPSGGTPHVVIARLAAAAAPLESEDTVRVRAPLSAPAPEAAFGAVMPSSSPAGTKSACVSRPSVPSGP